MKKEVFTQEFEKCFTVFQQVQLMKKYIDDLLENEHTPVDISGKVDNTTSFTDTNGNTYNGTTGWVVENDKLAYETKIHSSLLQDYNAFVHIGEDSIYLDNHYCHIGMDNENLDIHCDVGQSYSIKGYIDPITQGGIINIWADKLLHNGSPLTKPTLYLNEVELTFSYIENNSTAGRATFFIYTKMPISGGTLQSIFDRLVSDYDISYMNKYPYDKVNINDGGITNFNELNTNIVASRINVSNGVYPNDTGNKYLHLYYSRCKVVSASSMSGSYFDLTYYPNDQTYNLKCTYGDQDTIKYSVSQVISRQIL